MSLSRVRRDRSSGHATLAAGLSDARRRRLIAATLLLASARLPPVAQAAVSVDMPLIRVGPRCWFVQGQAAVGSPENQNFVSNAGFVVTNESVVLIDALGSPPLAQQLLRLIGGVTDKPVRHVLVTHYHADHSYGLQVFKDAGATIIAQRQGQDYLASDTARARLEASRVDLFPWIDERTRLIPADRWLDGDADLHIGGVEFRLRAAGPAHTSEDMVIHVPDNGVLYAGDLVFRGRIPFVGQADSRRWIAALEAILAIELSVLVPGHGPHSERPAEDLRLTRDYLTHLRATMGRAALELEPFDEAYRQADWSRFEGLPLFQAVNRMNAYNTYLLMEQERN